MIQIKEHDKKTKMLKSLKRGDLFKESFGDEVLMKTDELVERSYRCVTMSPSKLGYIQHVDEITEVIPMKVVTDAVIDFL